MRTSRPRHGERRIVVAEVFLHLFGYFRAERCAVAVRAARFRRAVTDDGVDNDKRRFGRFFLRALDRLVDRVDIVAVGDLDYLPALRFVALADVLGERRVGIALDRDMVAVVQYDQLAQFPGAGKMTVGEEVLLGREHRILSHNRRELLILKDTLAVCLPTLPCHKIYLVC